MTRTSGRAIRAQKIVRMYLDGVWDQMDDEPIERYAHIHSGSLSVPVHTTASPDAEPLGEGWEYVGTIDLDTGDVVHEGTAKPLGRS